VARNAFELICAGLHLWQQTNPVLASRWKIVFLGEPFDAAHVYPIQNVVIDGKVSLECYAAYLSNAAVGISLMISPHPSYPPLEMAEAGLATITNCTLEKDLRVRFPDIIALKFLTPLALAEAILIAVSSMESEIGHIVERKTGNTPPTLGEPVEPTMLTSVMQRFGDPPRWHPRMP
jgi:hypothetical protein